MNDATVVDGFDSAALIDVQIVHITYIDLPARSMLENIYSISSAAEDGSFLLKSAYRVGRSWSRDLASVSVT